MSALTLTFIQLLLAPQHYIIDIRLSDFILLEYIDAVHEAVIYSFKLSASYA